MSWNEREETGSERARADRLDMNWLTESLAVGGSFPTAAAPRLTREHRITHVVDLRSDACDEEIALARQGIRLLHLPTEDACAISCEQLFAGVKWVRDALQAGRRALIHCQRGIGRGPLLALCVLVARGMAPLQAMELAKEARAAIAPSPAQLRAFIAYARHLRPSSDARWLVPSVGALAAIAYQARR